MTASELVENIRQRGGVLTLDGDSIKFQLPESASYLVTQLRAEKAAVISILRAHGGRVATFPHCPLCASYALYRKNNIGAFECQTCGMRDIDEAVARRTN
jgi:Zn ribbon nucleic-acid-binding protein